MRCYPLLRSSLRAPLSTITVREYGVWGGAPSASAVQASFSLMEYDNYEFTGPLSLPAPTFNTDCTWTTEYTFDLAPGNPLGAPWDSPLAADFDIEVINIIGVVGTAPGTFVQKLGMEILVPEPGTLFLLCAGAAVLTGRRSHR